MGNLNWKAVFREKLDKDERWRRKLTCKYVSSSLIYTLCPFSTKRGKAVIGEIYTVADRKRICELVGDGTSDAWWVGHAFDMTNVLQHVSRVTPVIKSNHKLALLQQ